MSHKNRRKPVPTEPAIAEIETLSHEARGIATIEAKKVFISNALPNETVRFKYLACHSRYDEGRSIEIIKAAAERVPPQCPHFSICGGCSLQHVVSHQQLLIKEQNLREQLQHFANVMPQNFLSPITGPQYHYRHKARLGVRYVPKKGGVLVGFREEQSRYLAEINECHILPPSIGQLIIPLREVIATLSIYQYIAQIEVAIGEQDTALIIRNLQSLTEQDQRILIQFGTEHNLMIFIQPNKPEPMFKLYPADEEYFLSYRHPAFDITLWFHPTDFTQINPIINQQMVLAAIKYLELKPTDKVLDLFCGLGNFTLPISRVAKQVIGIEGSTQMVERGYMNAQRNQINNVEFYAADLSHPLPEAAWVQSRYDKILLDPARSGAQEILQYIPNWQPDIIVYVSCNPATLARDAGILVNLGYHFISAGIIDMFPQTNHVESIAVFKKSSHSR
jgi:23S rRNA (uracil1939-C5)-methyltransferase